MVIGATSSPRPHATVEELVAAGLSKLPVFEERQLRPGEAKTKLALLCFSSGTTGKPKAVSVSHYAMVANIIQNKLAIGKSPRYEPGDVAFGGKCQSILRYDHIIDCVTQFFHSTVSY